MKPGSGHCFFTRLVLLYLAILLGVRSTAWATPSDKIQNSRSDLYDAKKELSKTGQNEPTTTLGNRSLQTPSLRRPKLLEPAKITQEDPWVRLNALVAKQHTAQLPYVPLVQTLGVAVDYGRLAMNLCTKKERRYAGSLSILFRKNIQLSGTLGYQKLAQERSMGNKSSYTVAGYYGNIGVDYFVFYNPRNNLYAGLRYASSSFKNSTTPVSSAEQVISKDLTASWWELAIGSEHQLFNNVGLYAGFVIHLKSVGSFETFEPAANYVVPGYGRSVQNVVPSLTLHIKYQISLLKKQITFS